MSLASCLQNKGKLAFPVHVLSSSMLNSGFVFLVQDISLDRKDLKRLCIERTANISEFTDISFLS